MGMPVAFFEVASDDHERAQAFYAALFDWQVSADPEMGGYGLVDTGAGRARSAVGSDRLRRPATPASRSTFGCPTCRLRSPVPRSSAGRRWFRPRTCPATTDGSRSSPTRTATRSGSGLEMSGDDPRAEQATDEALRALAEPRRRAILRLVADDGTACRADRRGLRRHPHGRQPAPERAEERRAAPRAPRRHPPALPSPGRGPGRAPGVPGPDVGHVPADRRPPRRGRTRRSPMTTTPMRPDEPRRRQAGTRTTRSAASPERALDAGRYAVSVHT